MSSLNKQVYEVVSPLSRLSHELIEYRDPWAIGLIAVSTAAFYDIRRAVSNQAFAA